MQIGEYCSIQIGHDFNGLANTRKNNKKHTELNHRYIPRNYYYV